MIDVRRAATRAHTQTDWLDSRHSFSFGSHYDPANTHHGLLLVSNDDRVRAGTGFGTHGHQDMEIVTWVLSGRLEHDDSEGNHGELYPGLAQRMSAGTGIRHSEQNPSPDRGRALHPDVGAARHRRDHARLRAARHQRRARQGRPARDRVGPGPRRRDHDPPARRGAVGRAAAPGRDGRRCPTGPTCTCSSRSAPPTSRARARSSEGDAARLTDAGTPRAHRGRRAAPRS